MANYATTVRWGAMGFVGTFRADFAGIRTGDECVVRTERGVEVGRVLSPLRPRDGSVGEQGWAGEILRRLNGDDLKKLATIHEVEEPREFDFCRRRIQERGLPMKLVAVEHLFGGTKIIFYFLANGRVDFRELVKDLAQEYRKRIEMRQIGVRDEARLLADYEHCGRELCCKTFLKSLEPVTMKMAKNQKATLDPTKISGRCGRLMCCLRFEDRTYEDLKRLLPRKGARVLTPDGAGVVTGLELLRQQVTVELDDQREESFPLCAVRQAGDAPEAPEENERD